MRSSNGKLLQIQVANSIGGSLQKIGGKIANSRIPPQVSLQVRILDTYQAYTLYSPYSVNEVNAALRELR
jgi:hypothetical protein